jgi:hypothetical protein
VKRDAADFCKEFGSPTAILVCGDVAFSGQGEEFERAGTWLAELAVATGTRPDNVFTVPGNHDVVRSVIEDSQLLSMIHKELRPVDPDAVNERLDRFLNKDREAAELVFRPISNYNVLAARFGCDVTPSRLFWEHDIELNDGSVLRLFDRLTTFRTSSPTSCVRWTCPFVIALAAVELLVTVECRDRIRVEDVTWIEQLATKRGR